MKNSTYLDYHRALRIVLHVPLLRGSVTFTLDSGVEMHEQSPDTFWLPSEKERTSLVPGQFAKLMFRITDGKNEVVERMWVGVLEVTPSGYRGMLDNQPICTERIGRGTIMDFQAEHVIQILANAESMTSNPRRAGCKGRKPAAPPQRPNLRLLPAALHRTA